MTALKMRLSFQDLCWGLVLQWTEAMRFRGERIKSKTRRRLRRKARRTVANHMFSEQT